METAFGDTKRCDLDVEVGLEPYNGRPKVQSDTSMTTLIMPSFAIN
jgi:hypothetical protein